MTCPHIIFGALVVVWQLLLRVKSGQIYGAGKGMKMHWSLASLTSTVRSGSYIKQLYITWWRQRRFTQVRVAKRWASCWMHFPHLIPLFPIYLPFGALKCCKGIVRSFARSACTTFVYSTLVALLDSVVQAKSHFLQMHPHLPLCLYYINRLDVAIVGRLEKVLKSSRKGFCLFSRHFRLSSPRTTKWWWCRVSENISVDVCHVYVYTLFQESSHLDKRSSLCSLS